MNFRNNMILLDDCDLFRAAILGEYANNFGAVDISLPAAVTVFPGEMYQAPRS